MWKTFFKNLLKNLLIVAILFCILQLTKLVYPLDMISVLFGVLYLFLAEILQKLWR